MIRLHFVQNGEDIFQTLDGNTPFDAVLREVQYLQSRGMKMVGVETPEVKLFFDGTSAGMKSISGKFKSGRAV